MEREFYLSAIVSVFSRYWIIRSDCFVVVWNMTEFVCSFFFSLFVYLWTNNFLDEFPSFCTCMKITGDKLNMMSIFLSNVTLRLRYSILIYERSEMNIVKNERDLLRWERCFLKVDDWWRFVKRIIRRQYLDMQQDEN